MTMDEAKLCLFLLNCKTACVGCGRSLLIRLHFNMTINHSESSNKRGQCEFFSRDELFLSCKNLDTAKWMGGYYNFCR